MERNKEDNILRQLYRTWKKDHEGQTPDFEQMWSKAQQQNRRFKTKRRIWTISLAASLMLLFGLFFWMKSIPLGSEQMMASELDQWQAPTDQALIPSNTTISNWEAPTSSLLMSSYHYFDE